MTIAAAGLVRIERLSEKETRLQRITHKRGTLVMYVVERSLDLTPNNLLSASGSASTVQPSVRWKLPLTDPANSVGLV
jgi:hypothetical protein